MNLQDLVFFAGSLVFAVSLVPALRHSEKPPRSTSYVNSVTLCVFAVTYASLGLYLAAAISVVTSLCWLTLALQASRRAG